MEEDCPLKVFKKKRNVMPGANENTKELAEMDFNES